MQSDQAFRWHLYVGQRDTLERLRAVAAAAVTGNLRFGDPQRANQMAEVFRAVKAVDPMLGLFAAYAYLQTDNDDQIESLRGYMLADLRSELFDVAMLARRPRHHQSGEDAPVVPFCPILTQGWNYLRSRGIDLPPVISEAQDSLLPGPFTTFSRPHTTKIVYAMSCGPLRRS